MLKKGTVRLFKSAGRVNDFKPGTYKLRDIVMYSGVIYVCKKEGFHVAWNISNWSVCRHQVKPDLEPPLAST